jgi:kumamolisin
VDGATNSTGRLDESDNEVALDTQIIGAIAPDANQQLIFAPDSNQGFLDAITRATFPEAGEKQNSAISISWGGAEANWSNEAIKNMDTAFKKAALKGISVFAASGDTGAHAGVEKTDKYAVAYPASDPYVTGCGGTQFDGNGKEVVWNKSDENFVIASGGGISEKFDVPDFQKNIKLPENANHDGKPGRGVPDISGNAVGYRIRVDGSDCLGGETSAVAPLYAALMMRVNGALGHPVGDLNPFLYKNGKSGIFNDITAGNNSGYSAGPGWDACTGWGSINGQKFLDLLRAQGK